MTRLSYLLLLAAFAAGCWAQELDDPRFDAAGDFEDEYAEEIVADPISGWNRAMFQVNDRLYFWLLKPIAQGYSAVVPEGGRKSVRNVFVNVGMPVRSVSALLQGRPRRAGNDIGSFLINSTVGVLGLFTPAETKFGIEPIDEDLGQTFGYYGAGHGFYLVWPLLGPSSLRDTVGLVGDSFLSPISWLDWEYRLGARGLDTINGTSLRLGDYEQLKAASVDPYLALRDIYVQLRADRVAD